MIIEGIYDTMDGVLRKKNKNKIKNKNLLNLNTKINYKIFI
jgi:hypothetical protein